MTAPHCELRIFLFPARYSVDSPVPRFMTSQESWRKDSYIISSNSSHPDNTACREPYWPAFGLLHNKNTWVKGHKSSFSNMVFGATEDFPRGQGLKGHLCFLHFSRKEREKEQVTFLEMSFQETSMWRLPRVPWGRYPALWLCCSGLLSHSFWRLWVSINVLSPKCGKGITTWLPLPAFLEFTPRVL